jgi:hypothetical protein
MSFQADQAIVTLGVAATAGQAGAAPQILLGVDDAAPHVRAGRETTGAADTPRASARQFTTRSLRFSSLTVAYFCAGLTGWALCELALPNLGAFPDLRQFQFMQKNNDTAELLQATQKISTELAALQARMDSIAASQHKEPNVEELNKRIDAAKADAAAEIKQLSSTVEQLQREINTRLPEAGAAQRQAERAAPEAAAPRSAMAARAEDGRRHWRRRRGDAFDPTLHPYAPGAPRPLGPLL